MHPGAVIFSSHCMDSYFEQAGKTTHQNEVGVWKIRQVDDGEPLDSCGTPETCGLASIARLGSLPGRPYLTDPRGPVQPQQD